MNTQKITVRISMMMVGVAMSLALFGCGRDVKKYAQIVCSEMRDSEVACINGERRTATLADGSLLTQYGPCYADAIMKAAMEGGRPPKFGDSIPGCQTTADEYGLSVAKFFKIDQEMNLRCQHGDEKACLIACCGKNRLVQSMPTLPDHTRSTIRGMQE